MTVISWQKCPFIEKDIHSDYKIFAHLQGVQTAMARYQMDLITVVFQ